MQGLKVSRQTHTCAYQTTFGRGCHMNNQFYAIGRQLSFKKMTGRFCEPPKALGDSNQKQDRKGLKREDEPEEYWSSERERKGESPFKDPIALIGILAIFFPFIFLIIANAVGLVDLSGH